MKLSQATRVRTSGYDVIVDGSADFEMYSNCGIDYIWAWTGADVDAPGLYKVEKENGSVWTDDVSEYYVAYAGGTYYDDLEDALAAGARGSITVAVACAVAGIISGCINVTGLGMTLIGTVVRLSGGIPMIGLILTMLCCIVLGMGVPTTANYVIMATTCAPILERLGIDPIAAHFFVFYFGIVADITPPVALAAYAGSAIAKSNPMKTGLQATKLAIGAFIVPYVFALNPTMLFIDAGVADIILICITAVLGMFGVAVAMNGFLYVKLHWYSRVGFMAGGLLLLVPGLATDIAGLVILVALTLITRGIKHKREAAPAE